MLLRLGPGQCQPTRLDCGPTGHAMDTGYKLSLAYFLEPLPSSASSAQRVRSAEGAEKVADEKQMAGAEATGSGREEGDVGGTLRLYRNEGDQMREIGNVVPGSDRLVVWHSGLVSNERTPVSGGVQLAVLFWIHGMPSESKAPQGAT